MRTLVWARLVAACAAMGLLTSAWAQSPSGTYHETGEEQPTYETSTSSALLEEVQQLRQRVTALESQDCSCKAKPAPVVEECGPLCCDGKPAKEVPLKGVTFKVGGRIFWDNYWFDQDDGSRDIVGNEHNSTGFRAARIDVSGTVWENVEYQMEVDFAAFDETLLTALGGQANEEEVKFKNVYMQVNEIPVIHSVRIGHFKEPFSLEQLTSARFITFMERSLSDSAFVPGRNMGVQIGGDLGDYKDAGWWMGVFRSEDNEDPPGTSRDSNDWAYTTRACWLPYYDECSDGRYLVHVGGGFTYRNFGDGTVLFATRPELGGGTTPDPGPWLTVLLSSFNDIVWNAETAVVWGPLSLQAEYFAAQANTTVGADKNYHGWYVQGSYFLTGENREYRREAKAFYRIKTHENAWWVDTPGGWCFGRGAWELAARYDRLDLQDGGGAAVLAGQEGRMDNFTFGVNWYLNPNCRMMFNYIHSNLERIDGREGDADMLATRCQVDW